MEYYITSSGILPRDEYLAHHGILGMKWGVRRFQNTDGTLTPAGRERYHRMIADNVTKDRLRTQRAVINPAERVGLSYKLRNRHRNKIQKEIQEEFENTPEGARLKKANDKLAKIQQRMNNRDASLDQQNFLGSVVNRIGQNADFNRYSEALAEQNEAQKDAAKAYDKILKEYSDDILDATIKDLKIYEIDDGREFLEKYLRGDDDATFSKVSKKQERAEIRELKKQKQEAAKADKPEYVEKVETKNGETRYFYDKDELKAYKDSQRFPSAKVEKLSEQKKTLYAYAKDQDKWDIDFMEAVQNKKIFIDSNKDALLKEYVKYLDDPNAYYKNELNKLKDV